MAAINCLSLSTCNELKNRELWRGERRESASASTTGYALCITAYSLTRHKTQDTVISYSYSYRYTVIRYTGSIIAYSI